VIHFRCFAIIDWCGRVWCLYSQSSVVKKYIKLLQWMTVKKAHPVLKVLPVIVLTCIQTHLTLLLWCHILDQSGSIMSTVVGICHSLWRGSFSSLYIIPVKRPVATCSSMWWITTKVLSSCVDCWEQHVTVPCQPCLPDEMCWGFELLWYAHLQAD
jgi:hypothetical protein